MICSEKEKNTSAFFMVIHHDVNIKLKSLQIIIMW